MQTRDPLYRGAGLACTVICLLLLPACDGGGGGGGGPGTPGLRSAGRTMALEPHGHVLKEPVTVEMPYTDSDLAELGISDPSLLRVYRYNHVSDLWEQVSGSTVDPSHGVVRFTTTKLTYYRLALEPD